MFGGVYEYTVACRYLLNSVGSLHWVPSAWFSWHVTACPMSFHPLFPYSLCYLATAPNHKDLFRLVGTNTEASNKIKKITRNLPKVVGWSFSFLLSSDGQIRWEDFRMEKGQPTGCGNSFSLKLEPEGRCQIMTQDMTWAGPVKGDYMCPKRNEGPK